MPARSSTRVAIALLTAGLVFPVGCSFGVDVDALSTCLHTPCADASPEGSSDGAASDAADASDASDARDGSAADGNAPCPSARGAHMIRTARGFCIDVTEATNDEYVLFLASSPTAPPGGANACKAITTFAPSTAPAPGRGSNPIAYVDFCDAQAFCAWAGKSLCGDVAGGALDSQRLADPAVDAWFDACGTAAYPYGATYQPATCNGNDRGTLIAVDVGSLAMCRTAEGVFDLSGNVWEWTNACESDLGPTDTCYARGGAFNAPAAELTCAGRRAAARNETSATVGIRCCAP